MNPTPQTSVIVVSYNTREILRACLERLFAVTQDLPLEVIVVDNASRDGSADMVASAFPQVILHRGAVNLGFAAANNVGFRIASGDTILLLNPDALIEAGAVQRSLAYMAADPRIGMGGGLLLDRRGTGSPRPASFPPCSTSLWCSPGSPHISRNPASLAVSTGPGTIPSRRSRWIGCRAPLP
jgi:GT2 family glycosyltransferase